jgi:uncharacterized SAM-binding protein YcdF (DUF218 family)
LQPFKFFQTLLKYKKRSLLLLAVLLFVFFFIREKNKIFNFSTNETIDNLAPADCGVVLTGSSGRLREAFEILGQKKINKLIVSGVYKSTKLSEIFPLLPYYPEIKPESIILEKISGTTFENAANSWQLTQNLKCHDILLITSQLHMYRAYRIFKHHFPADYKIEKYAVINPAKDILFFEEITETFKSLVYSMFSLLKWLTGF